LGWQDKKMKGKKVDFLASSITFSNMNGGLKNFVGKTRHLQQYKLTHFKKLKKMFTSNGTIA